MGKIVKYIFHGPEMEYKENLNQLKKLIDWHIPENKKFVIGKIKKEQQLKTT